MKCASAPEGWFSKAAETVPQGLKPTYFADFCGTDKSVPFKTIPLRFFRCDCPGERLAQRLSLRVYISRELEDVFRKLLEQ
jgi:hypothetical protein